MAKSWGDLIADQIGMLPLHLTGITALAKAVDVVSGLADGEKPKTKDVIGAAGLIDTDGVEEALPDSESDK